MQELPTNPSRETPPFDVASADLVSRPGFSASQPPFPSDSDLLLEFWYDLLATLNIPDSWPEGCEVSYLSESKTLIVDYELPSSDAFPQLKDIKFKADSRTFKESLWPEAQKKRMYDDAICQIALAALYKLFSVDSSEALAAVVFNGWVRQINRATGTEVHPCILSVHVEKQKFLALDLLQVDPRSCFKGLQGISGRQLADASPIQPVLSMNREDSRFVAAYPVAETLDRSTNLAAMDWLDFENLIRELFEKEFSGNGTEVKITRASRDGGVDAVAFDPDPIRGGKIVIQAKRYTNVVELSAVRDLFGTVHNEGAMKGILVTTSDFGPDAYQFARGKPLTLVSGGQLLQMLGHHGYHARIDLAEARASKHV
jgi:restriction system protein